MARLNQLQHQLQQLRQRRAAARPQPNPAMNPAAMQLPFDAGAAVNVAAGQRDFNDTMLQLGNQEQQVQQEYGLAPGFDVNNPWSRAALLKQSFENRKRGSVNSYAAQGMLYDGALSNALDANRSSYDQGSDALQKQHQAALDQIAQRRLQAQRGLEDTTAQAGVDQLEAGLGQDPDPSLAPGRGRRPKSFTPKIKQLKQAIHKAQQKKHK